ncbi:diguanylate cyclase [Lysobacter sp. CFH 32150]|uniref:diguanylate cyclase n=1 Tax=Lysobacter sp. CFH 32150 TaxID=2927128 RepID=UPI001FA6D0D4|nr:diguanylate cyclase [Lysobacter sp. CFH 32150]MCI4566608.1 diguanylate cyclase [Lysobacter sp. CFH 32150]
MIEHRRFVGRIYRMRMLGLGTGVLAIAGVLYENGASPLTWAALLANGYLWPHVACLLANRSRDPERAEYRNLVVDSACGGIWIAVMQFNLLPSTLLAVMLSADKIGVGGWRFLGRTATFQGIACLLTAAVLGFPFQPQTTMLSIVCSLPFMFAYPLALSTAAYALGRKVVRQNRMLVRLNRTDALTSLWNRMHWEEAALNELTRCARTGRPAALLLMDIDHFKDINDNYGHPIGDVVLRRIGAILQASVREIDTPARFGGDEFGVVLAEAGLAEAQEVAERIRVAVEGTHFDGVPGLHCTVSIGVAVANPQLGDVATWISHADAVLYRSKQMGRNRVAVEIPAC